MPLTQNSQTTFKPNLTCIFLSAFFFNHFVSTLTMEWSFLSLKYYRKLQLVWSIDCNFLLIICWLKSPSLFLHQRIFAGELSFPKIISMYVSSISPQPETKPKFPLRMLHKQVYTSFKCRPCCLKKYYRKWLAINQWKLNV